MTCSLAGTQVLNFVQGGRIKVCDIDSFLQEKTPPPLQLPKTKQMLFLDSFQAAVNLFKWTWKTVYDLILNLKLCSVNSVIRLRQSLCVLCSLGTAQNCDARKKSL